MLPDSPTPQHEVQNGARDRRRDGRVRGLDHHHQRDCLLLREEEARPKDEPVGHKVREVAVLGPRRDRLPLDGRELAGGVGRQGAAGVELGRRVGRAEQLSFQAPVQ